MLKANSNFLQITFVNIYSFQRSFVLIFRFNDVRMVVSSDTRRKKIVTKIVGRLS